MQLIEKALQLVVKLAKFVLIKLSIIGSKAVNWCEMQS